MCVTTVDNKDVGLTKEGWLCYGWVGYFVENCTRFALITPKFRNIFLELVVYLILCKYA